MSDEYRFGCAFCGKDFGSDVIGLAMHIRSAHDAPRNCKSG